MLAFAHIPTGATANQEFNIDEVNTRFVEPAVALTAIEAKSNPVGLHLRRGFGCRMFEVHLSLLAAHGAIECSIFRMYAEHRRGGLSGAQADGMARLTRGLTP